MAAETYDVIIVGGSYAGLSAAMSLGRSLRRVLIVDAGQPCNRYTPHAHNFITQDGEKPASIAAKARQQVLKYDTVQIREGLAVSGKKTKEGFTLVLHSGAVLTTRKLIFATGIKDLLPQIPGFPECWGISVVHCPYCHGYEYSGKKTGILANGETAFHLAGLINNLTKNITILTAGKAAFTPEILAKLQLHGIKIIETEVAQIIHQDGQLEALLFKDGSKLLLDVLYAAIPFAQQCAIPSSLGCELTDQGYIKVDVYQRTTQHGIYACGDNACMMRSISNAVSSGNLTGAMVNKELTDEQF